MIAGQRWSRERPTVPGFYWYRETDCHVPSMVHVEEVIMNGGGREWIAEYRSGAEMLIKESTGEWQGPITPHDQEAG